MPPRKKSTTTSKEETQNKEAATPEEEKKETSKSSRSKSSTSRTRSTRSKSAKTESAAESSIVEPAAGKVADDPAAPEGTPDPDSSSINAPVAEAKAGTPAPPAEEEPIHTETVTSIPGASDEEQPNMPVPAPVDDQKATVPAEAQVINAVQHEFSLLTDDDIYYFNEGSHFRLYQKLGAHITTNKAGTVGTNFAVWAPNAEYVSVIGDFNFWDRGAHPLEQRGSSGIWEGFIPSVGQGQIYKYFISSRFGGYQAEKSDPFGFSHETPPKTASVVWDTEYEWKDSIWMGHRGENNSLRSPISIYEVHVGSWMRVPEEDNRWMTYRELAPRLAKYVKDMGFTHVEFMPLTEYPYAPSWGYQVTGFFAPTSRYGTPQDFMYLVDHLHQNGIGVILDWVPSHFPSDGHGLGYFDGTHLYEHFYPQKGWHPDWSSYIFNYGRHEVRSFLISSALFWLDKYHIDGLRVDAVASMLYLDYSRKEGEWMPNEYGGNENIDAIWFLRRFNEEIYKHYPDVQTIAEESTSWGMVSRPTYVGGLGFGLKWDMGWMHDTLTYMSRDPVYRKHHHNELSFRMLYAFHENFCLPLSHDEVVHGKGALLDKMPGDMWQQNANLRLLFGYMYAQPGKKLIFMGGEFGQWSEWKHDTSLDWHLTQWDDHKGMQRWIADLNHFYTQEPAMHELDNDPAGFEWIDVHDWANSTISLLRKGTSNNRAVAIVCNFTPVPRQNYRLGVPFGGYWREMLNSDGSEYAGSGLGNSGGAQAEEREWHGRPYSIEITLPPLSVVFFMGEKPAEPAPASASQSSASSAQASKDSTE
jgi:1,4-alpha-glucan branching enzyme